MLCRNDCHSFEKEVTLLHAGAAAVIGLLQTGGPGRGSGPLRPPARSRGRASVGNREMNHIKAERF
jgi:hypothetical protein